jgi:hypothetical protein
MISPRHIPIHTQSSPKRYVAAVRTPYLPPQFHRISPAEEPDPNLKFDPSDIFYPTELRCPNCDQISADSICSCGAAIRHPNTGELP